MADKLTQDEVRRIAERLCIGCRDGLRIRDGLHIFADNSGNETCASEDNYLILLAELRAKGMVEERHGS